MIQNRVILYKIVLSNIKKYRGNVLKVFILSLIFLFAINPVSITQEPVCIVKESKSVCGNCCCSDKKECCCDKESETEINNNINCVCKINEADPIEEQKDPFNVNFNFYKLISVLKSDLFSNTVDFDNIKESNFITLIIDSPKSKIGIYLEISSLRI